MNVLTYLIVKINRLPYEVNKMVLMITIDYGPNNVFFNLTPTRLTFHSFFDDIVSVAINDAVHFVVWIRFLYINLFFGII